VNGWFLGYCVLSRCDINAVKQLWYTASCVGALSRYDSEFFSSSGATGTAATGTAAVGAVGAAVGAVSAGAFFRLFDGTTGGDAGACFRFRSFLFTFAVAGAVVAVAGAVAVVAAVAVGCWQLKHIRLFIALAPAATATSTPHSAWMWCRHCGHLCVLSAMPPSLQRRPAAHGWLFTMPRTGSRVVGCCVDARCSFCFMRIARYDFLVTRK
jgi:hypothetical protein